ncbi:hypothetical protein PIB30_024256 [Stylosanthes scabra]|uniref:Ubiquitin-like protease family profile domain-containing protein n=1 Tax=Stylosanthes scabra TaxID=79078 RepID=A0ABU6UCI5_9FABA|nr:hypothetical protein [Stylosanthes scabra]
MGDKGKSVEHHEEGHKGSSAEVSAVDCVRWDFSSHWVTMDIPELNLEELSGKEQPILAVFNTFRQHLLERDSGNRALLQANGKQVKVLTDAVSGQAKMMELMWSEHCEMKKAMAEERDLIRKAIMYSLERSSSYFVPEKKLTIRDELLRAFGAKSAAPEMGTSSSKQQQSSGVLKRRLDFDLVGDSENAEADNDQPLESNREKLIKYGYVGSADFPLYLKVCFRPPPGMSFLMTSAACGAYAFSKSKDKSEILFQSDHFKADRRSFWALRPRRNVNSEILDAVATMCQDESHSSYWWLPTTFQEVALNPIGYRKASLGYIVSRYMGYVDETFKIFVPLRLENHWYLMIVNFEDNGSLVYLYSLKDVTKKNERIDQMNFVAFFLQNLLKDRKFYKRKESVCKQVVGYEFFEPYVTQQDALSNDSGVWVAHWMQTANLWSTYNPEVINDEHRYRLACSLITSKANRIVQDLGVKALNYYEGRDGCKTPEMAMPSDSNSTNENNAMPLTSDSVEF